MESGVLKSHKSLKDRKHIIEEYQRRNGGDIVKGSEKGGQTGNVKIKINKTKIT